MDYKIGSIIGGVAIGVVISVLLLLKQKHDKGVYSQVTYENLIAFAETCKRTFSIIVKSRVVCEKLDGGLYRITQIMLSDKGVAVRSGSGEIAGRIIKCRKVDEKIHALCNRNYPAEFDFCV